MNLKKDAWKPIFASVVLTVIAAYVLMGLFYMIGNGGDLKEILLRPKELITFVYTEENLKTVFSLAPFVILAALLYTFRSSIIVPKLEYASDFGLHGTSRWGTPDEVIDGKMFSKNNSYTTDPVDAFQMEKGIIVGKVPKKRELLIIPKNTTIDNRNVLVIGSSGSGKGQSFVFPNMINHTEETIIVTDPKGEIYEATHQIKRDQGYKVYQVDFINFTNCDRYNPLDYVEDDEDARAIANTIASNSVDEGKRDFWSESAVAFLSAFILYVKEKYKDKANMRHVVEMVARAGKDEEYLDEIIKNMSPDHPAYHMFTLANMSSGNTRAGIMATLAQQISIFAMQKIAKMTAKSDFKFHDLQKEKSVLYIKIRMDENPFVQLTATFFEQLIAVLYDIADKNHSKLLIPTIFLLDEFANIGTINKYPRVLATCRGLGMAMMTIIQDIGQLEDKKRYGPEMARSIINNHDTQLFLRTKDTKTAKYFSELAGETTVKHKQKSASYGRKEGSKSISEQYVKRSLITPGELMNMDKNTCYLFVSGAYPMKLEKAWQFDIYGDLLSNYEKYRSRLGYTAPLWNGEWVWDEEDSAAQDIQEVKQELEESDVVLLNEMIDEINKIDEDEEDEEITEEELRVLLGNVEDENEDEENESEEVGEAEELQSILDEIEEELDAFDEMEDEITEEDLMEIIEEFSEFSDDSEGEQEESNQKIADELPI
ncbi:VirD4-like conjugal transfer protein, CD1115 family [Saccharococcus thermophilus]|uniref:Type IV secretion system protein VirD4 n=1 Tax=Saccharococcus thermophilus TaxID=29396 RepID=A0A846MLT0_9BACL|nr:type IV secretory system conjugative DNA transfer family protein [Saccharococcus thermophilus]NIK16646.1 type IV secretion system protein VirD4 [Saccharococcus thermophilus]